ncbi:hypothetical protein FZC70_11890 [Bacillus subtilis]|nr:hypothetical protein [Bacillus subtilis]TYS08955.1 hypothetical protein FZC70_11890 [Bacillus subtilis]
MDLDKSSSYFRILWISEKSIRADSTVGLALETIVISPIALAYLIYLMINSQTQFFDSVSTSVLLMGSGVITALPLFSRS